MRALICTLIAAAVTTTACERGEPSASPAPASALTAGTSGEAPAGTTATNPTPAPPASDPPLFGSLFSREPEWREITLAAGTRLPVTLETAIGSDISRVEEPVQARLSRAVTVDGTTVLPVGSQVTGFVTSATRSGKVKGRGQIGVQFDTLVPEGPDAADEHYAISTRPIGRTAPATKKEDALKIGAPAAGGAIIGALVGGKKGAAIGTAVGGGAGTAVVLSTRGEEVRLGRGAALTVQLADPVTIRIRAGGDNPARR